MSWEDVEATDVVVVVDGVAAVDPLVVVGAVLSDLLEDASFVSALSPPFLRSRNELNSASGKANSLGSFGKGSGSRSSRAARLYIVFKCDQIASVPISRLSALDSRSEMQAMKKYLFIPTGFRPSRARNNWISDSGLHSSSFVDVDMVIVDG